MGMHQAIVSRTISFPCDCGEDDDHDYYDQFQGGGKVYTLEDSEDQLVDYDELDEEHFLPGVEPLREEEDVPEGKGITSTEG